MGDDEKNKKGGIPPGDVSEWDATLLQAEDEINKGGQKEGDGPHMVIVQGPHQGVKFPLKSGDNTIGRLMGSEILLEDQSVSRHHAIITQGREGWTVEDNKSKNGTLVNGQKISEKVTIGHGDVVQVGIYSLRLITKQVTAEDEKPLPADWEGKTVMMGAHPEEDTATIAEGHKEAEKTGDVDMAGGEKARQNLEKGIVLPEVSTEEKKRRPLWLNIVMVFIIVFAVSGAAGYLYLKVFHKPAKPSDQQVPPVGQQTPPADQQVLPVGPQTPPADQQTPPVGYETPPVGKPAPPANIPVFLDFASSPLSAKVTFQGQDYGVTPVKVQLSLDTGKSYSAEAAFDLTEIGEVYKNTVTFTVKQDEPLIPVLFKGPIGVMKVMELPKEVVLYLEGYFIYDPFNAKTAKLTNVVFGKPVYIPYGKYIIEIRKPKELAGSGEFMEDIRYRREVLVTEDSPVLVLQVTEDDLNKFPVEIVSVPENADVFIDAEKVGVTPYKGIFPLGEHALSLRKDGYFEYKQELKMDKNVPVRMEIELKTTESGELINAGKYLMQKGMYKDAISKLTDVFKMSPTNGETAQARYLIGSCFIYLSDLATAEGYFKQSIEDEGMKYPSMLGLVSVYQGLGRRNEAIPLLVDVLLNAKDETVKKEAMTLFQQVSPLKSIMYIFTEPDGARVYLNDKLIEQLTPMILPDLSLGNYRVKIEKDGYISQDLNINMSVSEFNPVVVKLKPVPQ